MAQPLIDRLTTKHKIGGVLVHLGQYNKTPCFHNTFLILLGLGRLNSSCLKMQEEHFSWFIDAAFLLCLSSGRDKGAPWGL